MAYHHDAALDRRALLSMAGATLAAGAVISGSSGASAAEAAAPKRTAPAAAPEWIPTWTGVTVPPYESLLLPKGGHQNKTLRQMVCSSMPGKRVRIRVSNRFGHNPLKIGAASIGVTATPHTADLMLGTIRRVTFKGQREVDIAPGQEAVSDPLDFDLLIHQVVGIDLYFPAPTGDGQFRSNPVQAVYQADGNHVGEEKDGDNWDGAKMGAHGGRAVGPPGAYLVGLEIPRPTADGCIVIAGDSTNFGSWPQWMFRRLHAVLGDKCPPVVERTISGQAAVHSSHYAPSLLDTFDDNILSVPGVRQVIFNIGANDFVWLNVDKVEPWLPANRVTQQEMLDAFGQFAKKAHARGVEIYACTVMAGGATFIDLSIISGAKLTITEQQIKENRQKANQITTAVNEFIKTSGAFDGWFDFYKATVNRLDPTGRDPMYSPDNIHSNAAGWYEMVQSIDINRLAQRWS